MVKSQYGRSAGVEECGRRSRSRGIVPNLSSTHVEMHMVMQGKFTGSTEKV